MLQKRKGFFVTLALALVLTMVLPVSASAAAVEPAQPVANAYIDWSDSYITAVGGGDIQIWFEIIGTGYMQELGTLRIELYEATENTESADWEPAAVFMCTEYPEMMGSSAFRYTSYVPYEGIAGRYYKAYVTFWAEDEHMGGAALMWTEVTKA